MKSFTPRCMVVLAARDIHNIVTDKNYKSTIGLLVYIWRLHLVHVVFD